jgi:hypothetical protein
MIEGLELERQVNPSAFVLLGPVGYSTWSRSPLTPTVSRRIVAEPNLLSRTSYKLLQIQPIDASKRLRFLS